MKNKKIICGTMLLLFVISGFCNVINISATQVEVDLPPLSYYVWQYNVDYQDKLEIYISSSGLINTYIMNEEQVETLYHSNGLTWNYLKRWKDMTYLEYTYTIPADGVYYVVIYNKNLIYTRTVYMQVNIDYYDPLDLSNNILKNVFFFVIIPIIVIGIVIVGYIVFRKKSPKEPIIQIKEIPKVTYCPECGIKVTDITKDYCYQCGSKIIK